MRSFIALLTILLSLTACSHTYYVVRHAEKAVPSAGTTMSSPNDPPLSEAGQQRAQALKELLQDKSIRAIYSTNTLRTKSTAEPLRVATGLTMQTYGPMPDSTFIRLLKGLKHNTLVVGHSNTVDNIVNGLTGASSVPGDLADSEYDNLFVVKYKKFFGTKISYERRKYGAPSGK
jgi:broad specificity phosphatase PhoE